MNGGDETFKLRLEGDSLRQRRSRKLHLFMCVYGLLAEHSYLSPKNRLVVSIFDSFERLSVDGEKTGQFRQNK
jgi:hypothetical protein